MTSFYKVSVVIPTHNRRDLLLKVLDGMNRQDYPRDQMEVIVVADDCRDGTEEAVKEFAVTASIDLKVFRHSARSAAATRNLGAAQAVGEMLIFLDDDILVTPGFVRAHVEAVRPRRVVIGYSKPVLPDKPTLWGYNARLWWEDEFRRMATPGYRFTYRDLFSGNFSLPADIFWEVGGFDVSITGRLEDYELGYRLIKLGVEFHFEPKALGYHQEGSHQRLWLSRVRQEGVADVQISNRHPELRAAIFPSALAAPDEWRRARKFLRTLAFGRSRFGGVLASLMTWMADGCERLRLRGPWFHLNGALREYWYWRGVAEAIGSRNVLAAWLQEASLPQPVASDAPLLDLSNLPPRDKLSLILETADEKGLRLFWKGMPLFTIPPVPGVEPLRLEHLWRMLWDICEREIVPALALDWVLQAEGGPSA